MSDEAREKAYDDFWKRGGSRETKPATFRAGWDAAMEEKMLTLREVIAARPCGVAEARVEELERELAERWLAADDSAGGVLAWIDRNGPDLALLQRAEAAEARLKEAENRLEAKRNRCEDHSGSSVACGQCYGSISQHLKNAKQRVENLEGVLRRLDRKGGLGPDVHDWIAAAFVTKVFL